jgi:hypothetical protein
MSNPNISYVQYFIPTDGDSEDHPNVFVVRRPPRGLTLGDVEAAFPLPGKYLFRAKMATGKTHGASPSQTGSRVALRDSPSLLYAPRREGHGRT